GQPGPTVAAHPRPATRPAGVRLPRRFRGTLRSSPWVARADTAFERVVARCADAPRPGQRGTWITPAMRAAYQRLHALGHAHSVEVYAGPEPDAALVGGIYGVAIGRMFFGERRFSVACGGPKAALASLAAWRHARGWPWIDAQVESPHLLALGAETVPRARFLDRVAALAAAPGGPGRWTTAFGARPVRQLAAPG